MIKLVMIAIISNFYY